MSTVDHPGACCSISSADDPPIRCFAHVRLTIPPQRGVCVSTIDYSA